MRIKVDSTNYTIFVEFGTHKVYPDGMNPDVISTGDYAVLKGKHGEERLIVDDALYIYGRYEGVETYRTRRNHMIREAGLPCQQYKQKTGRMSMAASF